jgi:hypothetical protein
VVFAFSAGEQFGDIIVAEARTEAERARFSAVWFGGGRIKDLIEAEAESGINNFFERFAEFSGTLLRFGCDIRIERQGGSHIGIMMPTGRESRWLSAVVCTFPRAIPRRF